MGVYEARKRKKKTEEKFNIRKHDINYKMLGNYFFLNVIISNNDPQWGHNYYLITTIPFPIKIKILKIMWKVSFKEK